MAGILVVDDHPMARRTICTLLSDHRVFVCGEAMDGEETVLKVRKLKPDIVLLDINMPVMNGIQAAYEIRRIAPSTKVIFLTIHDAPEFKAGMRPRAHGSVSKSAAGKDLIPTLERVVGITADEVTIECPHCKVSQNIHVAARTAPTKKDSQYITCINCNSEFDVKLPDKIVGGPLIA